MDGSEPLNHQLTQLLAGETGDLAKARLLLHLTGEYAQRLDQFTRAVEQQAGNRGRQLNMLTNGFGMAPAYARIEWDAMRGWFFAPADLAIRDLVTLLANEKLRHPAPAWMATVLQQCKVVCEALKDT